MQSFTIMGPVIQQSEYHNAAIRPRIDIVPHGAAAAAPSCQIWQVETQLTMQSEHLNCGRHSRQALAVVMQLAPGRELMSQEDR